MDGKKQHEVNNTFRDLIKYKDENIIYIPDRYVSELNELTSRIRSFYAHIYNTDISVTTGDEEYLEPYQTGYLISLMDITGTKIDDVKGLENGQLAMELVKRLGGKFQAITERLEEIYKEISGVST